MIRSELDVMLLPELLGDGVGVHVTAQRAVLVHRSPYTYKQVGQFLLNTLLIFGTSNFCNDALLRRTIVKKCIFRERR
jgi:hypothetical protein